MGSQLKRMMEQGRSFSGRERNCCFLNVEGQRFATVSAVSGLDYPDDARAIAVVDWDQDGDLDLWISNRNAPRLRFMRNDSTHNHHRLVLQLRGDGKISNRDAIGARVEVVATGLDGKRLIRTLRAGEGLLSQSGKTMHFGLGNNQDIEKVIVHWPGGGEETFTELEVDRRYLIEQGTGEAWPIPAADRTLAITPAEQPGETATSAARVPLIALLPMPRQVEYTDLDGNGRLLRFGDSGKPTLIVLWASWCAPCRKEMEDLASRASEIQSAGLDVVALSVDGLNDDGTDPNAARVLCEQLDFPFSTGKSTPDFVQLMTGYHHMLVAMKKLLPVPTSFLVDSDGKLSVIYKGPMDIDQLLEDARQKPQSMRERSERAASLPGRTIDHDGLLVSLQRTEANALCAMGIAFASGGRFEDAIPLFRAALEAEPEFGEAHQGLGQVLEATNQDAQAIIHYHKAAELFPDRELLPFRLGNAFARQGKWDEAIADYSRAIGLKPDYWEALAGRGNALMQLDRRQDAAADFRAALKINPRYAPAQRALSLIEANNR